MALEPTHWPSQPRALGQLQLDLAQLQPDPWAHSADGAVGGCFVCFARGGSGRGSQGDRGWAGAVTVRSGRVVAGVTVEGAAGASYAPGLLALREGPLLEMAVTALCEHRPEVLLVNATGRDHPRRAGLALQLGWAAGLPSVGVTHRPLLARGDQPADSAGAVAPLSVEGDQVGWWLRTRVGAMPVAVSPGWRTDLDTIIDVVMGSVGRVRTPEPLRQARRLARSARSASLSS
ncbi:MAG: endonuclease V [Acidimicrobiia bacterium]|jgi:deoxyribonuclease V